MLLYLLGFGWEYVWYAAHEECRPGKQIDIKSDFNTRGPNSKEIKKEL
jgi:hypothetical protein